MIDIESPLVLSLRPRYADLMFEGKKRAEFRRRMASVLEDRLVFVYVTSPVREVRGGFHIGKVWKGTPDYLWHSASSLARMGREEFDTYFKGCSAGVALGIERVWEFGKPITLDELRRQCADFVVPQSWRYLKKSEQQFLEARASWGNRQG